MRYILTDDRLPQAWFNVVPHLPEPLQPPLHPGTRQPVGPDDLAPLFPMALIGQEVSAEPWIDIPGEVLDVLRSWRPTPLVRARRLEEALGTPARIYYKDESVSPAGSHKPNTAVPQAFYNKAEGVTRLTTETGAGQWGSALGLRHGALRPRVQGLHGAGLVRAEALPPGDDGGVGGRRRALARRRPRPPRLARLGHQRRRARRGGSRRHALLARVGAQPRPAAPDGDRPRGQGAAGAGGRGASRHHHRVVRRRLEPRRDLPPVRPRRRSRPAGRGALVVPHAHRGPLRVRLRRHGGHDAAAGHVHAGPRLRPARRSTPGACATTGTPPSSATWSRTAACGPSPIPRERSSTPRCNSPAPRAPSPPPRRPTPSGP